jgi:hypothetical protein
MIKTSLNNDLIKILYDKYVLDKEIIKVEHNHKIVFEYIDGISDKLPTLPGLQKDASHEIIKSLRFNKVDKINFEYAKMQYLNKELKNSINTLEKIVQKINSDWRTCYRAFFLLSQIYYELKNPILSKKYFKLCKSCNPDYPLISSMSLNK